MNNQNIYSKRFASYSEAQQAYKAQRTEMEEWALTRARQHIFNAQRILDKYNQNREHKITTLPGLPILGTRYQFKEFTGSGLIFTYETTEITGPSWARKPQKIQKEFLFPTEWLSLSTWDFNKLVRNELKEAIEQQKKELAAEKRKVQSELRKQIRELNAQAAKLQAQIDSIQKSCEMNSNDRYMATMEKLTASKKSYHKSHLAFLEAKVAFQEAEAKFAKAEARRDRAAAKHTKFYAVRLERLQQVIVSVVNKHNAGRPYADEIHVPGYAWTLNRGTIEILRLTEKQVTFRFKLSTNLRGESTYSQEYTLGRSILSASDREVAKQVRAKLWEIRNRNREAKERRARAEAIEEQRKLAASIAYEERKLKDLRKRQAQLEKKTEVKL